MDAQALAPTVELIKGQGKRTTGWGWSCSCGDGMPVRIRKREIVLNEARRHFNTKHGGAH